MRFHIASVLWQSLIGPWRFSPKHYDLVLNLDAYGTATGGRRRATVIHDLYFKSIPEYIPNRVVLTNRIILNLILMGSNGVISISKTTAQDIKTYYPWASAKVRTIYSSSTLRTDPPPAPSASIVDYPYILSVANSGANKNMGVVARAMVKLNRTHPEIGLVHVGSHPTDIFTETFKAAGVDIRLSHLKGIDESALVSLYQNALCLCVSSIYEGFCLPIVEAQKLGCPVVFSNRSAAAEVGGDGGLSFDPVDADELAGLFDSVASRPDLREDMKARGYANADRFSWDRAAAEYEAAFAEFLAA